MTLRWAGQGQIGTIALVGLFLLAMSVGLAVATGASAFAFAADGGAESMQASTAATSGETLVVAADGGLFGGSADCPDAEYSLIQNAVDDAEPGDTVEVCEGTYSESVTVETDDVAVRANGTVEVEPGLQAGFDVTADDVTIDGFTVNKVEGVGMQVSGDRAVIESNHVHSMKQHENTARDSGIRLQITNDTVVRNNTVVGFPDHGISVAEAEEPDTWTNDASDNLIVNNYVTGETDTEFVNSGIYVGSRAGGTVVQNNTITDIYWNPAAQYAFYTDEGGRPQYGIGIWINGTQTEVRGNTIDRSFWGITSDTLAFSMINNSMTDITFHGGQFSGDEHQAIVRDNTLDGALTGGFQGILSGGSIVMAGNTVRNVECAAGYAGGGCGTGLDVTLADGNATAKFIDNRVVNNTIGIRVVEFGEDFEEQDHLDVVEIHGNVIMGHEGLGISNSNRDSTDGHWPIIDARNNFWDCDGPSGGLEDPVTGRIANGTGDGVSAGDETGVSNVNFDPFYVHKPERCENPQPTPTPTRTPTPAATDDDDSGGSGGSTGYGGSGGGFGTGGSAGTDDGTADGDTSSDTDDADTPSDDADETPTETATPPSESPSPTISPTPLSEPGFGVLSWMVGVVTLVGILAVRRRRAAGGTAERE